MLTYKAMYKNVQGGVHAEVLDFPGAITFGRDLDDTRQRLASALVDMAETNLLAGEAMLLPDPTVKNEQADLLEPITVIVESRRLEV